MIYKSYGNTGIKLSAVGFGGMRFDIERSMEENAGLVRYACSKGINYFDTAPSYCDDLSEEIYGLAFRDMPGPFYVSTKARPQENDTADKARASVERSLQRLGVSKIDFYHIWCIRKTEHYELAMQPGGQYDGLLKAQEEGLIGHICLSSHQPGHEVKRIVDEGKVEGILLGVNILNFPYRWEGVQAAYDAGYGVVAMNPLGGGMIPNNEDKLAFLAGDEETPTEAALRFVLSCPQITVALNGFTTREHIDMACRVADNCTPLSQGDMTQLRTHLSTNMDSVCTACGYCNSCPQQIPIPAYMQVYNQKQMFGVPDDRMIHKIGFELSWGTLVGRKAAAHECIECGQCEDACTQHLNIIDRLKEFAEWEAKSHALQTARVAASTAQ